MNCRIRVLQTTLLDPLRQGCSPAENIQISCELQLICHISWLPPLYEVHQRKPCITRPRISRASDSVGCRRQAGNLLCPASSQPSNRQPCNDIACEVSLHQPPSPCMACLWGGWTALLHAVGTERLSAHTSCPLQSKPLLAFTLLSRPCRRKLQLSRAKSDKCGAHCWVGLSELMLPYHASQASTVASLLDLLHQAWSLLQVLDRKLQLSFTAWGECGAACGAGYNDRTAICADADGIPVDVSACATYAGQLGTCIAQERNISGNAHAIADLA